MAEIQESSGKTGKSQQKKFSVRVDFTPMVDMNMLLITFFMLCTSLSKPQTMEISMPTNDKVTEEEQTKIKPLLCFWVRTTRSITTSESPITRTTLRSRRRITVRRAFARCCWTVTRRLPPASTI